MTGPEIEFVGGGDPQPLEASDELAEPRRARRVVVGAVIVLAALVVTGLVARAVHSDPAKPAAVPAPLLTATNTPVVGGPPVVHPAISRAVVGQDGVSCLHRRADGALLYGVRLTNLASSTIEVHGVHVPRGADQVLRVGVGFPCGLPRQLLQINHNATLSVGAHEDFWVGAVIRPPHACVSPGGIAFRILLLIHGRDVTDVVAADIGAGPDIAPSSCSPAVPAR